MVTSIRQNKRNLIIAFVQDAQIKYSSYPGCCFSLGGVPEW